ELGIKAWPFGISALGAALVLRLAGSPAVAFDLSNQVRQGGLSIGDVATRIFHTGQVAVGDFNRMLGIADIADYGALLTGRTGCDLTCGLEGLLCFIERCRS